MVTGEVCAPTNLVFRGPENPVSAPADRARVGRRADEKFPRAKFAFLCDKVEGSLARCAARPPTYLVQ